MVNKINSQSSKKSKEKKNEINLTKSDKLQYEIIFKLENLQNHNDFESVSLQLRELSDLMKEFVNTQSEVNIALVVELWSKISNIALNCHKPEMTNFAINCLENALSYKKTLKKA